MTLAEAVKSGKRFRHKNHSTWFDLNKCYFKPDEYELNELISDDWEIQTKQTFTREDVERACRLVVCHLQRWPTDEHGAIREAMRAAEGEV